MRGNSQYLSLRCICKNDQGIKVIYGFVSYKMSCSLSKPASIIVYMNMHISEDWSHSSNLYFNRKASNSDLIFYELSPILIVQLERET